MAYDFSQLNDKEFEVLANNLLEASLNVNIERFKPGRDEGVDGRYFISENKEVILQCKHYLGTGYSGLIRKLKNEERPKVEKLKPNKYIFITSLPLSRNNKNEIKEIFSPYIKSVTDVIGQESLNDLLSKNPNIEEKHYKLWISSTNVFNRIINNAIKGRSEYELERIQKKSYKFIITESYEKALKILIENQVLIITGEPGIGKTTLAENVGLYFSSKDYEFIDVENSLIDAENIFTNNKKQIFYYDDFLGSNYLEAITDKKDSHIIKFIDRVKNDKKKLFILTSRTNILNNGVVHSSVFSNKNIKNDEYMLTITALSELDRAKILYNHIWFSKLNEEYIEEIYLNKRYMDIIQHQNFNPRLIEYITDTNRISQSEASSYWEYIINTLDNPKDIWKDCFKIQNNAYVRNLVILTVFNGGKISEGELRFSFDRLEKNSPVKTISHIENDFNLAAELATKSFLQRNKTKQSVYFTLFNPSISDFILIEYCDDIGRISNVFKSLSTLQSLGQLVSLRNNDYLNEGNFYEILDFIFNGSIEDLNDYDYQIYLLDIITRNESKKEKIIYIISKIIEKPKVISNLNIFLCLLKEYSDELSINNFKFISLLVGDQLLDEVDIEILSEFMVSNDIADCFLEETLKESLEELIYNDLELYKNDIDLSDSAIEYSDSFGEEFHVEYDENDIQGKLSNMAYDTSLGYTTGRLAVSIDLEKVVARIDIDDMIQDYKDSVCEPQIEHNDYRNSNVKISDIDDLFERT